MRKKLSLFRKLAVLLCTCALLPALGGCLLWNSGTPKELLVPEGHYRLEADFSNGTLPASVDEGVKHRPSLFKDEPIKSQFYNEKTKSKVFTKEAYADAAMEMAAYLSEWTGLDFALNSVSDTEDGLIVDWSKTSTLLAGLDDREQKEDFRFSDSVTLNWFMMDTLASTLHSNLPGKDVYYCSEGKPLVFTNPEDMAAQGLSILPIDEPYYGSHYYVAQANK